jgi:hypothetical protein
VKITCNEIRNTLANNKKTKVMQDYFEAVTGRKPK